MEFKEKIQLFGQLRIFRNPWHKDARLPFQPIRPPAEVAKAAMAAQLLQVIPEGWSFSDNAEVAWEILPHRGSKGLTPIQQRLITSVASAALRTPPLPVYVDVLNRPTVKSLQKRDILSLAPVVHHETGDRAFQLVLAEAGWLVAGLLLYQCAWCGHEYDDDEDRQYHWTDDCPHNQKAIQLSGE